MKKYTDWTFGGTIHSEWCTQTKKHTLCYDGRTYHVSWEQLQARQKEKASGSTQ
jgi:hypothetical protein